MTPIENDKDKDEFDIKTAFKSVEQILEELQASVNDMVTLLTKEPM
jgi:hypothetical protein